MKKAVAFQRTLLYIENWNLPKEGFSLSVLLCYTAKRDYSISAQEQKSCRDVVECYTILQ
jgi:hypothetical protein